VQTPDGSPLIARFRRARTDEQLAVLEGLHAVKHALRFSAVIDVLAAHDPEAVASLAARLAPDIAVRLAAMITPVARPIFDALSPTPPETGLIAIAARPSGGIDQLARLGRSAPIVLLESPTHSGNIGAAIRVAAAAGAAAVVTTGSVDPWNPGALRGSAGLHFALPVWSTAAIDFPGRTLVALDPAGDELAPASIPADALIAFGSERAGLSHDLLARADLRVRIPMEPGVSSLNLATAVAVVLYAWRFRQ
jgi:tRNA G18 (ribose-2'-O)-methylase SpoU